MVVKSKLNRDNLNNVSCKRSRTFRKKRGRGGYIRTNLMCLK